MATRDSIHTLVETLKEDQLEPARLALETIQGFDVTPEDRRKLLQRQAECDRGEVVDAHVLLESLSATAAE